MGKKWERFKHLDEGEYWQEICQMSEEQLRREHKIIQQNIISAHAAAGASGAAGFFTFGIAWAGTAVAGRRINVNQRQCKLIEQRLNEKGWNGYNFRKRDFAYSVGPCLAAELLVPAGGALVGHAGQVAAQHTLSTAGQHAAQAASQHASQLATQHAAENLATHHPVDALSSVAHHTSTFAHSAVQGAESEVFTATHGVIGHVSVQTFYPYPVDLATAEAAVLGTAAGQVIALEGTRALAEQAIKKTTKLSIRKAIKAREVGEKPSIESTDDKFDVNLRELQERAAKSLLDNYYKSLAIFDYDGNTKGDIDKVDTCDTSDCECKDYDDAMQSAASKNDKSHICLCGHKWAGHTAKGKNGWILQKFCETWYPRFENRDSDGRIKKSLSDIEPCKQLGCPCGDYNRNMGKNIKSREDCTCDHAWGVHHGHVDSNTSLAWIVGVVASVYLRHLVMSD